MSVSVLLPLLLILCLPLMPAFASDRPAVRVTTGAVRIEGWQDDLVKGNPNLSRWQWSPIYVYKQAVLGGNHQAGRSVADKPGSPDRSHKPLERSHYIKPIHIPFNPKALKTVSREPTVEKRIDQSLSGKLKPIEASKDGFKTYPSAEKTVLREPGYSTYETTTGTTPLGSVASVHGQLKAKPGSCNELSVTPKKLGKGHNL